MSNYVKRILGIFCLVTIVHSKSHHRQMTVIIAANDDYCVFVPNITSGQTIEFDFSVTDSTGAEGINDITVRMFTPDPNPELVFQTMKEQEGSHHEEAVMDGDYQLCFDNRMSTWAEKTVYFEVTVHDPQDDYYDDYYLDSEEWRDIRGRNYEDYEEKFEMKSEDMQSSLHKTRLNLGKVKHFQFMGGADMSRDTHNVMGMKERLDTWSFIHLSLILIIGFTQIYFVRQLFEEKSFWHRFRNTN